ncbi:DNA-binding protein [Rhodobacter aestuarii]|uniref:DNA-binding protein n=1 Tax=Rhodobacter aestuarii TaxID=453582 RepID=A0A1N7PNA5_9RHOB|nr:HU family DNA-binding protein [Rhodobacter aestuarii]PTV94275.1 DNA-binding protein [Rhodobacter aestuarii]SIT12058.1 DNA-binding protein [Rhodobacter aestuarii]
MAKSKKSSTKSKSPVKLAVVTDQPIPSENLSEALAVLPVAPPADEAAPVTLSLQVKKREIVERVALRSGAKKAVARDMTDAVLAVLAEALAAGETLVLPPLGKLTVQRQAERGGADVLHLKLKRPGSGAADKKDEISGEDPLAEGED